MAYLDLVYRRDAEGVLQYLDAWTDKGGVVVHTGKVGHRGRQTLRRTGAKAGVTAKEAMAAVAAEAAEQGYAPIPDEDRGWVVLQVWTATEDLSHPEDERMMNDTWDALDLHLKFLGVGECDGNDVGGKSTNPDYQRGTVVNWFCPVVDAEAGIKALRSFTRAFHLGSNHVIGVRPRPDDDYTLAFSPRKSDTEFRL